MTGWLRGLAAGALLASAASPAQQPQTLRSVLAGCQPAGGSPCVLTVRSPQALALAGTERVPAGVRVQFLPGGSWQLSGGTLDFAGARVEAPETARVFSGRGQVRNLSDARPEWFAPPMPDGTLPAEALARAYRGTVPWGTIWLRAAEYVSPFNAATPLRYTSPRTLVGTARPVPDADAAPTRLLHGTVIDGEWRGTAALRAVRVGFDSGPEATRRYFAGAPGMGLYLAGNGHLHDQRGTRLQDVSVLTTDAADMHSVLIEGQDDAQVDGLWLWSLGGLHGLILKSADSSVRHYHCRGATADCLLIKSDYMTDRAGRAVNDRIEDVDIRSLHVPGDTGGVTLDGRWDQVRDIAIDGLEEHGTQFGLVVSGSPLHQARDIWVRRWTAEVTVLCAVAAYDTSLELSDVLCSNSAASGQAFLFAGRNTVANDITIGCAAARGGCAALDGVLDRGDGTVLRGIHGDGLGGFLLRAAAAPSPETRGALDAAGMGGRVFAPERIGAVHVAALIAGQKPLLRILWTMAVTWPAVSGGLLALLVAVSGLLLWRRRRVAR